MAAAGRRGRIDRISGKWQEQQLYFFLFCETQYLTFRWLAALDFSLVNSLLP
jgi:hypothetical protein